MLGDTVLASRAWYAKGRAALVSSRTDRKFSGQEAPARPSRRSYHDPVCSKAEADEAAARGSGAWRARSRRRVGDGAADSPARPELELGARLDQTGAEWARAGGGPASNPSASVHLRSRGL